ncbi:MAG: PIN domain-containing protein [Proteobacteria bacterium]|nr:PIN domain-containing protein [Pseudomonadota bacterium]
MDVIEASLHASVLFLAPPILTDILSDPSLPRDLSLAISQFPLLAFSDRFWMRAGALRAQVLKKGQGRKARLADALIAQFAIDHDIPLVTRDTDFKYFSQISKLKLAF